MARKLTVVAQTGGWKSAGLPTKAGTGTTATTVTSPIRSCSRALQILSTAGALENYANPQNAATYPFALNRIVRAQFWVRIPSFPTTNAYVAGLLTDQGASGISLYVQLRNDGGGGFVRFFNAVGAVNLGDSSAGSFVVDTWQQVRIQFERTSTTNVRVNCWLDSTQVVTNTDATVGSAVSLWTFFLGFQTTLAAVWTVYYDQVAVNDDSGSADTGWPSPTAQSAFLLPSADSVVDARWSTKPGYDDEPV